MKLFHADNSSAELAWNTWVRLNTSQEKRSQQRQQWTSDVFDWWSKRETLQHSLARWLAVRDQSSCPTSAH